MTFTPNPKPSQKEGAKPKKPSSFKAKPKLEKPARKVIARVAVRGKPSPKAVSHTVVALAAQTKGALIQSMLVKGATSKELEAATGWKPHSVRGYLGTLRKQNVNVVSHKVKGEPTVYRLETAEVL